MKNLIKKISDVMNYGDNIKRLILFVGTMAALFVSYQVVGFVVTFIYENLDGLTIAILLPVLTLVVLLAAQAKYPKDKTLNYSSHVKKYL